LLSVFRHACKMGLEGIVSKRDWDRVTDQGIRGCPGDRNLLCRALVLLITVNTEGESAISQCAGAISNKCNVHVRTTKIVGCDTPKRKKNP
jgi:hypothetical protein